MKHNWFEQKENFWKIIRSRLAVVREWRHLAWTTALFLSAVCVCSNASAQLIYQDAFPYPDGPLLTAPGSPWVSNVTPSNQIDVVSGELFLTQTEQESVRYTFSNTYTEGNLSASFKVRVTALPNGSGNFFAFFRATTSTYFCRVWISTNGAAAGKFRFGITSVGQPVAMIPVDVSLGETHTLVMNLFVSNVGNYTSTLWVDPVSESDTSRRAQKVEGVGVGFLLAHFCFKQHPANEVEANGMGNLFVDDLRIGRVFNDVTPLRLTSLANLGADGVHLLGAGIAGTHYNVLANTNLATTNWLNIGTATANTNGVIDFTDAGATNRSRCFYRLVSQ